MTKKDFELIARVLNATKGQTNSGEAMYDAGWEDGVKHAAREFASQLALTNPRFDKARFLSAAGF